MTRAPANTSQASQPAPYLRAREADLRAGLKALQTFNDVARLLELQPNFLKTILYGVRERTRYTAFQIPRKTGGDRTIQAPPKNIKILQEKINHILALIYRPRLCVHGFAVHRSVKTNADLHWGKRWVLNVDLRDFFGSVTLGRIIGVLGSGSLGIPKAPATVLAQIATLDTGVLPQGSPCSPIISNMVAYDLDTRLMQLAKKHRCTYSRYADDISFSTTRSRFPPELATLDDGNTELGDELNQAIDNAGFHVNQQKVRLQNMKHRQDVTGLTVNEFPNVRRSYIRAVRSILHAWRKFGYENAEDELHRREDSEVSLRHYLRGKLAYLEMVRGKDDPIVRRLLKQFGMLCPELASSLPQIVSLPPSQLRGHRSPSLAWEDRFRQLQSSVWFLEVKTKNGGIAAGTAFKISNEILATAGHNLEHGEITAGLEDGIPVEKHKSQNVAHGIDVGLLRASLGATFRGRTMTSQCRLPEIGEQVAAVGFPNQPCRHPTVSLNVGIVESLPVNYLQKCRFIQVSFQSAGGLSGAPLVDRGGHVLGIVVENTANPVKDGSPAPRSFGQVVPFEYLYDLLHGHSSIQQEGEQASPSTD